MPDADPFDLNRFVTAQAPVFTTALDELKAGRKRSHWTWFIFPQLRGLGHSAMAEFYGISSLDEAREISLPEEPARRSASRAADHSGPTRRRRTTTTWGERVGGAQSRAGRESVRLGAALRTCRRTWSSGMPIRPAAMVTCCSGSAARSCAAATASSIVGGS